MDIEIKTMHEQIDQYAAELRQTLKANREKWEKAEEFKRKAIEQNGNIIGLIMYKDYLDSMN